MRSVVPTHRQAALNQKKSFNSFVKPRFVRQIIPVQQPQKNTNYTTAHKHNRTQVSPDTSLLACPANFPVGYAAKRRHSSTAVNMQMLRRETVRN